jgi:hypothetical protein
LPFRDDHAVFSASSSYIRPSANLLYGFDQVDCPSFADNGTYLAMGCQKSVRYVEGPTGDKDTALVIESKVWFSN